MFTILANPNLDYSVDILGSTAMWRPDAKGIKRGRVTSAESIAFRVEYQRITWTEGTKRELSYETTPQNPMQTKGFTLFGLE